MSQARSVARHVVALPRMVVTAVLVRVAMWPSRPD